MTRSRGSAVAPPAVRRGTRWDRVERCQRSQFDRPSLAPALMLPTWSDHERCVKGETATTVYAFGERQGAAGVGARKMPEHRAPGSARIVGYSSN